MSVAERLAVAVVVAGEKAEPVGFTGVGGGGFG